MFEFRGFRGTGEIIDGIFQGRVVGISDVITFEAANEAEAEEAFRASVLDYLDFFAEHGEKIHDV